MLLERFLMTAAVACALMGGVTSSVAAPSVRGSDRDGKAAGAPAPAPVKVSDLLDQLAKASDEAAAAKLAARIETLWERSGSDTADLLASRGAVALARKDAALAIELMDRALALRPDWAEGYNKRAAALFALGDSKRAMVDLQEVLKREPRQFNALAAVGMLLQSYDDDKDAMKLYRRALAVHPYLDPVKKAVERLAPDVDGRDL